MRRLIANILIALITGLVQLPAYAALDLILTQGIDSAQPIAVVPFANQTDRTASDDIAAVIQHDLQMSGRFKPMAFSALPSQPTTAAMVQATAWHQAGMDSVVVGQVQPLGDSLVKVDFSLVDVYPSNRVLVTQQFTIPRQKLRYLAHHIADIVYEKLIGIRGVFSTRLAYVLVQETPSGKRYSLNIADADGYNAKPILMINQPIMSPTWSHDGKRLAYVTFENRRAQIFVSDISTGSRQLISSFAGINGAPAWSPDNQKLALVLSRTGSPKIYILDLVHKQLRQITQGRSIDTEPTWFPDGQSIAFTSDREGSPQVYQINVNSGAIKRLTYTGNYNARPFFTADGKSLMVLHKEANGYNVALQDLKSGRLTILTHSGRNDSPSLAPNSSMILFGTEYGELGVVSSDGRVSLRLPAGEGRVQSPAWSPYL